MSEPAEGGDEAARIEVVGPLDLARVFGPFLRNDPTAVVADGGIWRALWLDGAPATCFVRPDGLAMEVRAWGAGAAALVARMPALTGLHDDPEAMVAHHPVVREAQKRFRGLRIGRGWPIVQALLRTILHQKVTSIEAFRAEVGLARAVGLPAPGPRQGLLLPPRAAEVGALSTAALRAIGVDRQRAETLLRAASVAHRVAQAQAADVDEAKALLGKISGVGPWTIAHVVSASHGDPDAVPVGDYHLPNLVCWALAREPRGDDARMLELLEPYRGHRFRVTRLLELHVRHAPRYGPRRSLRPDRG